jgi:hypothetical protein
MKVDYCRFSLGGLHGKHVVATWKGKTGTITAFALGPRKTKKNLCREKPVSNEKPVSRKKRVSNEKPASREKQSQHNCLIDRYSVDLRMAH